ncbi:MAG: hypothetical protein M3R63_19755 [Actinomycetota bacterium]|nr:hypothetical protein [Actinomycetota bacterium]
MTAPLAPLPSERWHVGRWTMPAAVPGEPGTIGVVLTHDELLLDVIVLARHRGWRIDDAADVAALMDAEILVESTPVGTAVVKDDQVAAVLRRTADRAFQWLAARAPDGYVFALRDGLYLDPASDLDGAVVAPEAALAAAHERGIPLPRDVERMATAHVTPSADSWVALDLPFVAAGPFDAPEDAAAVIERARDDLATALRRGGAADLADTRPRWIPVPVEMRADRGDQ